MSMASPCPTMPSGCCPIDFAAPIPGTGACGCSTLRTPSWARRMPSTSPSTTRASRRCCRTRTRRTSSRGPTARPLGRRADGDRLVSVAAQVNEESGAAHLVSVCTDPEYRGRGLARHACTRIMRTAISEGAPMLILEMYVGNEAGRRAYRRWDSRRSGATAPVCSRTHCRLRCGHDAVRRRAGRLALERAAGRAHAAPLARRRRRPGPALGAGSPLRTLLTARRMPPSSR